MAENDLPPTHRRRWRVWMRPGFAEEEWRELAALADDLKRASEHVTRIGHGMSTDMPGASRIQGMGRRLFMMSRRWEKRVDQAKQDAITDGHRNFEWMEAVETEIYQDHAVTVMSRALAELEAAERLLGFGDKEAAAQLRNHRVALDDLYAEVYVRDPRRNLR